MLQFISAFNNLHGLPAFNHFHKLISTKDKSLQIFTKILLNIITFCWKSWLNSVRQVLKVLKLDSGVRQRRLLSVEGQLLLLFLVLLLYLSLLDLLLVESQLDQSPQVRFVFTHQN